tara:strand:- start:217 stop:525 length:309 start_codon:yes stop_codon:yes gene_type:complete
MKRRAFLKSACLASACLLPACKSSVQHAIGAVKLEANNFAASLLSCTHNGCAVTPAENGFVCSCHGARFEHLGHVIKGPAKQDLTSFDTSSDQQFVTIYLPA